jgi:membrane protein DedA with SNARE-associated domain
MNKTEIIFVILVVIALILGFYISKFQGFSEYSNLSNYYFLVVSILVVILVVIYYANKSQRKGR